MVQNSLQVDSRSDHDFYQEEQEDFAPQRNVLKANEVLHTLQPHSSKIGDDQEEAYPYTDNSPDINKPISINYNN